MTEDFDLPNMAHGEAKVTAEKGLNLRNAPSLQGRALRLLAFGEQVTVWQTRGAWWWVQAGDGLTGWAHSGYLKPVGALVRGTNCGT